jgi:hypothetical protein
LILLGGAGGRRRINPHASLGPCDQFTKRIRNPQQPGPRGSAVEDLGRLVSAPLITRVDPLVLGAVSPARPQLQPRRVPGDVPVERPLAEWHVQALAGRVGADPVEGATLLARWK